MFRPDIKLLRQASYSTPVLGLLVVLLATCQSNLNSKPVQPNRSTEANSLTSPQNNRLPLIVNTAKPVPASTRQSPPVVSPVPAATETPPLVHASSQVSPSPTETTNWYRPPVNLSWQWQLTGTLNTHYSVDVYDIDLFDTPMQTIQALQQQGKKVICYFSAGSSEDWRPDHDQFQSADLGKALDGWPGEKWLDIRSARVSEIMKKRLELAKSKGCDAVEPDNVDGYANNTGFGLSPEDQLAFNRFLAEQAHQRGMGIGLKNDLDQVGDLVNNFDFSVNEECHSYDECALLKPFIDAGKPVLNAEYESNYVKNTQDRDQLCQQSLELGLQTLVLPLDLDDSFRFACWEQ